MSNPTFEKIEYKGWKNCFKLSNGLIELVLTGDVGPRVIRFGFPGQDNEFWEDTPALGLTGGDEWRIYGGHRLWHAPEEKPRTYYPDNGPVEISESGGVVTVTQPTEPTTGIQKQMIFTMAADAARVAVEHRLINRGAWPIDLAPWAISPMAPGGVGVVPLPERGLHADNLQPTGGLALWAYTDFADPRWTWGTTYALLRQDASAKSPQKVGSRCAADWLAYARNDHLFINRFIPVPDGDYPDFGCRVEVYTDANMLEIESLAPYQKAQPGEAIIHTETWLLFDGVPMPKNDNDVVQHILPHLG
jgi:hypothetical protein